MKGSTAIRRSRGLACAAAACLRLMSETSRYPTRGTVSTNCGSAGSSPSAARSRFTAAFRLCSKSTNVPFGHSRSRSSSLVTTSPARSRSAHKIAMEDRLVESVARPRFFLRLSLAFAGVAVLLAGVGVYGTAAYWVTRRRRELAVRIALGATQKGVLALVVGRSIRLAGWGCAIGLAASFMVTRAVNSLLFETSPREPIVLVGVTVFLAGLVMLACCVPALRASRLDPAAVLRAE